MIFNEATVGGRERVTLRAHPWTPPLRGLLWNFAVMFRFFSFGGA